MENQNHKTQSLSSNQKSLFQGLIDQFGEERAAQYLREVYFPNPDNFFAFTAVFSEMMSDATPMIHRRMVGEFLKGGRVAVCLPRGGAKSTITNTIFAAWAAIHGRYDFILVISDTHTQAKLHVGTLKNEIETNEIMRWIYPGLKGSKWGEESIEINNTKGTTTMILPLGAGMKVRGLRYKGKRPQLAILDDLENSEMVYSAQRRKKLKRWFDFDLEPGFDRRQKNIFYIGTILHYHSLLKQVIDKKGKYKSWRTIFVKAIENNKSFWQSRFPIDWLRDIRDNPDHQDYVGSIVFAQEYQNEPQDDRDRVIKLAWLKEYSFAEKVRTIEADNDELREKKFLDSLERVGAIDPAISEKESADFFAMYAFGFEEKTGNEYMLDVDRTKEADINTQTAIACDFVEKWRLDVLGVEAVAYQSGLATLVRKELQRRRVYCRVVPIKTDKDKIRRARIHSSAFEAGFIHLRTDCPKYDILKTEIEEFPMGEHDDTFDALMLSREVRKKPKVKIHKRKPSGF